MLKIKPQYVVAVAGATGDFGGQPIELIPDGNFPVCALVPLYL